MNKLLLAAMLSATALGGAAVATQIGAPTQSSAVGTPTPPAPSMQKAKGMGPPATREEATQRADQLFAHMDADGNGQVTTAERTAMQEARAERREMRGKGPMGKRGGRGGDRMLARLDANGDGNISREEHRAQALERFARIDANADGRVDAAEQAAIETQRTERRERMTQRRATRQSQPTPAIPQPQQEAPSPAPMSE